MFNISVFEVAGCGDAPDQGVDNGPPGWRVGVAAGVPLCVGMSIKESEPPTLDNVFSFFLSFLDTQRFMGPSGNL